MKIEVGNNQLKQRPANPDEHRIQHHKAFDEGDKEKLRRATSLSLSCSKYYTGK